jgi:putative aldouronate transport system substrate-binding protein
LDQKELELFTKIITNKASVDEFDQFAKDWNSLGGEQITKEVNDWYAKR